MDFDDVFAIASAFPGIVRSTSYGTPSIKLGTKFLLREREPGFLALQRPSIDERDMLIEADPELFFITDHYKDYPYVLIRMNRLKHDHFRALFETIWRENANRTQISAYHPR